MPSLYGIDPVTGMATLIDDEGNTYEVPQAELPPDIQAHPSTGVYNPPAAMAGDAPAIPPPAPVHGPPPPPPAPVDPAAVRQKMAEGAKSRLGFLGKIALNPVGALTQAASGVGRAAVRPVGQTVIEAATGQPLPPKTQTDLGGTLGFFQPKGDPPEAAPAKPPGPKIDDAYFYDPSQEPPPSGAAGGGVGLGYSGSDGGGYTPDMSGVDAAMARADQAVEALGRAQERGFQVEEKSVADAQQELEASRARYAAAGAEEKRQADAALAEYRALSDQIGNWQEDPGRLWRNKSALEQGVAALFAGISGALTVQGVQRENVILKAVDRAIDRDIAAQRAEFQKLQAKAGMASNAYSMAMQSYGNAKQAELAVRGMLRESLALKAQQASLKAQRETARATLEMRAAELMLGAEKDKVKLATDAAQIDLGHRRLSIEERQMQMGPAGRPVSDQTVFKLHAAKESSRLLGELEAVWDEMNALSAAGRWVPWRTKRDHYMRLLEDFALKRAHAESGAQAALGEINRYRMQVPKPIEKLTGPDLAKRQFRKLGSESESRYNSLLDLQRRAGRNVSGFDPLRQPPALQGQGFGGVTGQ